MYASFTNFTIYYFNFEIDYRLSLVGKLGFPDAYSLDYIYVH